MERTHSGTTHTQLKETLEKQHQVFYVHVLCWNCEKALQKKNNFITPGHHKEATLDHHNQLATLKVCECNVLSLPSRDD